MPAGNRSSCWMATLSLLAVFQHELMAQPNQSPVRLWSVSLALGGPVLSQSSNDVESAMRAGGFDEPSPGFNGPGQTTPHSRVETPTVLLTVRRRLGTTLHVRGVVGNGVIGETIGYGGDTDFRAFVFLRQSVTTFAVMAGLNGKTDGSAWVSGGLGFHHLQLERSDAAGGTPVTANRLGPVVSMGLALPARKRFFLEIQGQYRLIGTVDVPAIDVQGINGIAGTVPPSEVNFSHGVLSLGFGVRF